jgi:hypothetical protein
MLKNSKNKDKCVLKQWNKEDNERRQKAGFEICDLRHFRLKRENGEMI